MFSRNFMKQFPVRKYADITARGILNHIKPVPSILTFGFLIKDKYELLLSSKLLPLHASLLLSSKTSTQWIRSLVLPFVLMQPQYN